MVWKKNRFMEKISERPTELILYIYMVFNRTRKQRNKRGGSPRSEVISNYWGTCRFEKGRKKTRCLLDKQRGFWDAHGFKGNVYKIYEDKDAKEKFLQNVRESNKKRITDYLDENRNENDRFIYRHDPHNDLSDSNDVEDFKLQFKVPHDIGLQNVTAHSKIHEASAPKPGSKIPVTHRNKSFFDQPSIEPLAFQKGNPIIGTTQTGYITYDEVIPKNVAKLTKADIDEWERGKQLRIEAYESTHNRKPTSTTRVESEYDTPEVQTLRASSHSSVTPSKSNSRDILLRNVTAHSGTRSSQRQKKEAKRHRIIPVVNAYRNQRAEEETAAIRAKDEAAAILARRFPNVLEFESESSETPQLTRRQRKRISQKQSKAAKLSEV